MSNSQTVLVEDTVAQDATIKQNQNKINNKLKKKKNKPAPKLEELSEIISDYELEQIENVDVVVVETLKNEFSKVSDPRNPSYVKHKVADVLIIILFAVCANCNSWYAIESFAKAHKEWLTKLLGLENGVPTDNTFRVVLMHIDMEYVYRSILQILLNKIDKAIEKYSQRTNPPETEIISFDGKASNSSGRHETYEHPEQQKLHTLNAYSANYGACLDQRFFNEKTNEIPEMPMLIKQMNINGAIVTCDALNTQPATAQAVVDGGGKYVMPVKGNKKTLYGDLVEYFDEGCRSKLELNSKVTTYIMNVEKEHGGTVIRMYYFSTETDWLYKKEQWPNLSAIGMVRRITRSSRPGVKTTCEDRYYICGGIDKIEDFVRPARQHWGVENSLHWQLDFTFDDDANKTMENTGAKALQLIKKASLTILKVAKAALFPSYRSLNDIRNDICHGFETQMLKILSILDVDSLIRVNCKKKDEIVINESI
jgi:predicted transposase YbfD/YdcC